MSGRSFSCPHEVVDPSGRGWFDREPSDDEREVLGYLRGASRPERVLHVGVGTSLFRRELGPVVIQGLTKDGAEAKFASELGYEAILCNKYDVGSYSEQLRVPYDVIIDVNIRSYACCDEHFLEFMGLMRSSLSPGGTLLTSLRGLAYLVPTSLSELRRLCPTWRVRSHGNVVVLAPRRCVRLFGLFDHWR